MFNPDKEAAEDYVETLRDNYFDAINDSINQFNIVDCRIFLRLSASDKLFYLYSKINDILYLLSSLKDVEKTGG